MSQEYSRGFVAPLRTEVPETAATSEASRKEGVVHEVGAIYHGYSQRFVASLLAAPLRTEVPEKDVNISRNHAFSAPHLFFFFLPTVATGLPSPSSSARSSCSSAHASTFLGGAAGDSGSRASSHCDEKAAATSEGRSKRRLRG